MRATDIKDIEIGRLLIRYYPQTWSVGFELRNRVLSLALFTLRAEFFWRYSR